MGHQGHQLLQGSDTRHKPDHETSIKQHRTVLSTDIRKGYKDLLLLLRMLSLQQHLHLMVKKE